MGCRGCKAHQAHIESLEKQLDFFRNQLQPYPSRISTETYRQSSEAEVAPVFEELPWVSEEEEELLAMKQAGIDIGSVQNALERVGAMTNEIEFS